MGNRLTLPLLLLAALLAGGAFFWMTGSERRAATPSARGEDRPAAREEPAPVDLARPAPASGQSSASQAPSRVELAEAPSSRPAPQAKKADQVALSGRVVDRFGTAIAGARVAVAADTGFPVDLELEREFPWLQRKRTQTDAEGRFRFEGVEPGTLQLAVRASGFAPHAQRSVPVPKSDTELEPLVLARGAILSGQVVDPDGRGVAGARIVPDEIEDGPGTFFIGSREPSAVTGADGRFRVDELACGAWRFLVHSEDHPDLLVEGIAEEPGVEQGGLRWQLAPGAIIAGTVTGIPSGERGKLEVRTLRGPAGDEFMALGAARVAKVEDSGAFVVRGLEVGQTYTLQARQAEPGEQPGFWERSRSNDVQARAGESGVMLAYQPEAALLFTVFDSATHAPLERFDVESGIDWPAPLRDDQGRPRKVFPGGAVRVGGLRPGSDQERARLNVRATGYSDYERADIAVRAGQELDLGPIYLDPVPVVRVHVTDRKSGEPIVGASVRVQKQQGDTFSIRREISIGEDDGHEMVDFGEGRSGRTDEHGWAEITSFEGETVQITARAKGYAPGKLEAILLPRGERSEQELALTRGGEVLVHVLDAQGMPLPGAPVEHRSDTDAPQGGMFVMGGPRGPHEVTDSEGTVLFENLAPGLHSFRIGEKAGGGPVFATRDTVMFQGGGEEDSEEWSQIQVVESQRGELTLRSAPRAVLTGRVREAGKVLAGATLRLSKEGEGTQRMPRLPGMGGGSPEARSDGEGRYHIDDVKEGSYTLVVEHPTRRMPQEFTLALREGENTFDVDLALSIVSGRVADEKGKGLAGVHVWPERKTSGAQMRFRMVMVDDGGGGGVVDSGQFGERALTDADGRYTLRGVTSDVDLVVKAEGDAVQPGQSESVRLAPNEVKEGVDLTLEPAGSILVEAKLSDGAPARFQLVQAEYLGESDPPQQPKFGFLQQGSTELNGLRPGRWKVNMKSAQGGPGNDDPGQDQEIEVKARERATLSFQVD